MRPNHEDRNALLILLDREELPEKVAEFLESLHQWTGEWTPRQGEYFDRIVRDWL